MSDQSIWDVYGDILTSMAFYHLTSFFLCCGLFCSSFLWISLTTRQLVSFYIYLAAFATVPLSYFMNAYTVSFALTRNPMEFDVSMFPFSILFSKINITLHSWKFFNVLFRCDVVKTSADNVISQILDIFSHELGLFSTQLTLFRPKNSIGLKKRLKSYEKLPKICQIILSADVFTSKQNLTKHSTVPPGNFFTKW